MRLMVGRPCPSSCDGDRQASWLVHAIGVGRDNGSAPLQAQTGGASQTCACSLSYRARPNRVAERHQRPLHRIRLSLIALSCARPRSASIPCPAPMPSRTTPSLGHADFGDVGHAPAVVAGVLGPILRSRSDTQRISSVSRVQQSKTEYPIGLGYRVPAFDVGQLAA